MRPLMIACVLAGCAFLFAFPLLAQANITECDPALDLAQMHKTQQPKGRLQDAGAPQTVRILKLGKKAIPMLIACLTDESKTKKLIEEFWPVTTVGDVAFFYLSDLFTDSTWEHSTINGVIDWKTVQAEDPNSPAWTSWYEFVKKYGRKYVQNAWSKRWKEEESAIFWDAKERCFKVSHSATQEKMSP